MESELCLQSLSDDVLLRRLTDLVSGSRRVEAELVAHIGEVDARRLYARAATPSMFHYCTQVLHLSEAEAYARITVARAARMHPVLLSMLRDGRLHLSGLVRLVPHLTLENRDAVLERAKHLSRREILELVAELQPRPDVPAVMRKLPVRRAAAALSVPQGTGRAGLSVPVPELCPGRVAAASLSPTPAPGGSLASATQVAATQVAATPRSAPSMARVSATPVSGTQRRAIAEPLSPGRYKVQFTASADLHDKLERLLALLRRERPDADLAAVVDQAVSERLERLEARRYATTRAPRTSVDQTNTSPISRHIPAPVRRAVRARDGDRCRYVDEQGRDAPNGIVSSSTTSTRSASAATTVRGTSASSAGRTTRTWPSTTTAKPR